MSKQRPMHMIAKRVDLDTGAVGTLWWLPDTDAHDRYIAHFFNNSDFNTTVSGTAYWDDDGQWCVTLGQVPDHIKQIEEDAVQMLWNMVQGLQVRGIYDPTMAQRGGVHGNFAGDEGAEDQDDAPF